MRRIQQRRIRRRLVWGGLILAFLAIATFRMSAKVMVPSQAVGAAAVSVGEPPTDSSPSAFVHLFEWTWNDVAQECEAFLGPMGYDAVQISPPNEHAVLPQDNYPWWQRYQPVSYKLQSRSGDRIQLVNMIRRCHRAGVKVYADAVINHMAAIDRGVGSAGTPYTKYNHPELYSPEDFHTCRRGIESYQDRYQVISCELVGLADLKTSSPRVQRELVKYLKSLVDIGVDGFRIDAAKHIAASELGEIVRQLRQQVNTDPYIYQEVIDPGNEAIKKSEYYDNGDVHEFEYGRLVSETFLGEGDRHLAQLETLGESWGLMPSDKAVVFIDNHDKQRGHGGGGTYLTYKAGKLYELANVFMLAYPYGYPQVMSSYRFDHPDQGPPADTNGATHPVFLNQEARCFEEWQCEHRWAAIANMVGFRKVVQDAPLTQWWSNGREQIAFGRGDQGFVAINLEDQPLTHTFQTELPPGTYCDIAHTSLMPNGQCADPSATIVVNSRRQAQMTVAAMDAIAIHLGSQVAREFE
ncbi:alpha-amylase [Leptolyngbya sp. AN02str]|uniref:alpha-amylase n=1 Tax=Leptolyngbya sp. AN02str TaxID=3423363 RepID=UPI003D318F2A